jgi:uncharacterized protein HemX
VDPSDLSHRIIRLETAEREMRDALAEHRVRLENGTKVFAEVREQLPRPMPPSKVIALTLAVVTAAGGALWSLSEKLAERPTTQQVQRALEDTRGAVTRELQATQAEQRVLIEQLTKQQASQSEKLDEVLERVRAVPGRGR